MVKQKPVNYIVLVASLVLYAILGYGLSRHETIPLLGTYTALFLLYLWVLFKSDADSFRFWLYASVLIRIALLPALPHLSDDFYRFIWDGRLLENGIHPFAHVPSFYMEQEYRLPGINRKLYEALNSPDYFTIYPPVAQFVFWLSVKLSPESILISVMIMRILIILAEVVTIRLMQKIVVHFGFPIKSVLIYALNPLVIIELTGNLHFEAFMITFLMLSGYALLTKKLLLSATLYALSICTKLLPLLFFPLILLKLGWKRGVLFFVSTLLLSLLMFAPLLTEDIVRGFKESIPYYFNKFEFNASVYYLIRELGYHWYGFNIIQLVGFPLALISGVTITLYSLMNGLKRIETENKLFIQRLSTNLLIVLFIYLLFTPVVHPWYVTPLLFFSVFTQYRFVVVWTFLVFFTYSGYTSHSFKENLWVVAIEYGMVLSFFLTELFKQRKRTDVRTEG